MTKNISVQANASYEAAQLCGQWVVFYQWIQSLRITFGCVLGHLGVKMFINVVINRVYNHSQNLRQEPYH